MVGEPGFIKEAMTALKAKVLAEKQDGQEIFARRCWMGCQEVPTVCRDLDDDSLSKATKALVFIAVSVNLPSHLS